MTLGTLKNPGFVNALTKLVTMELPMFLTYRIRKVLKRIEAEQKELNELHMKLLATYAKKDEKGEFVYEKDAQGATHYTFETEDKRKKFNKKYEELLATEVKIPKLKIAEFPANATMSTAEMLALEPIFQED